jgi:hypothetical protein
MTTKWHMKPMKRLFLPGGVSSWVISFGLQAIARKGDLFFDRRWRFFVFENDYLCVAVVARLR